MTVVGATCFGAESPKSLPASVDVRAWCPPVENQGALGSCTANAGVGMVEYFDWSYAVADFDKEPPAFCYAFAQNYQAISYYRLDSSGTPKDVLLSRMKTNLAGGPPHAELLGSGVGERGLRLAAV